MRDVCSNALGYRVHKAKNCTQKDLEPVPLGQPVHVFAHVTASQQLGPILSDMLFDPHESGLMKIAESINICVSGESLENMDEFLSGFESELLGNRIRIHHVSTNSRHFELPTINKILEFARSIVNAESNAHVLYIHSKGLFSESGAFVQKWYWRKTMQYWLIRHHVHCRKMLDLGYDTVGLNPIMGAAKKHSEARVDGNSIHYSGNFWWASARHLARLKQKLHTHGQTRPIRRFQAENLILSKYHKIFDWRVTDPPPTARYDDNGTGGASLRARCGRRARAITSMEAGDDSDFDDLMFLRDVVASWPALNVDDVDSSTSSSDNENSPPVACS